MLYNILFGLNLPHTVLDTAGSLVVTLSVSTSQN